MNEERCNQYALLNTSAICPHLASNLLHSRTESSHSQTNDLNLNQLYFYRSEEIVKYRRVVGSDWLEYIYNV